MPENRKWMENNVPVITWMFLLLGDKGSIKEVAGGWGWGWGLYFPINRTLLKCIAQWGVVAAPFQVYVKLVAIALTVCGAYQSQKQIEVIVLWYKSPEDSWRQTENWQIVQTCVAFRISRFCFVGEAVNVSCPAARGLLMIRGFRYQKSLAGEFCQLRTLGCVGTNCFSNFTVITNFTSKTGCWK